MCQLVLPLGTPYARIRLSTAGGLSEVGLADDGEIEDYIVALGPLIDLQIDNTTIAEKGGVATITATISQQTDVDVIVDLGFSGGANAGMDYEASTEQIVIPAGALTGTATISGRDDALDEFDEPIVVDLIAVTGAGVDGSPRVSTKILDDDQLAAVRLSIDGASLNENGGMATITATTQLSGKDVVVDLSFSGTATSGGVDFSAPAAIHIPAGQLTGTAVLVSHRDLLDEADESIFVDIESVTNGNEDGAQQVAATIIDDGGILVGLSLDNPTILENGGEATISAKLSDVSTLDVIIDLGFSGASTADIDFSVTGSSIFIPAGSMDGTITVTATQDVLDEIDETVIVDIEGVTNGSPDGVQAGLDNDN